MCVPVSMGGPGNCKPYDFWAKRAKQTCSDIGMKVVELVPRERCTKTRFVGADVTCCNQEAQECVLEVVGSPKACKSDMAWTAIAAKVCGEQGKSLTHLTSGVSCGGAKHRFARFECCGIAEPQCDEGESLNPEVGACCPDAQWVEDCLCAEGSVPQSDPVYDDAGCLIGTGCSCAPHPCSDASEALCDMIPPECGEGEIVAIQGGCYSCVDPDTCEPPVEECVVSGCSGQICAPDVQMTTCEWNPEYACLQFTTCGMSPDGSCGWEMNDAYLACLEEVSGGMCGEGESYDDELGACCPDAIYIADCWCEDGSVPEQTTDYDEKGCLLGYGCQCVPQAQGCYSDQECPEGTSCNAAEVCLSPPECEPGDICPAVCYGYCVEEDACEPGSAWDEEVSACCPEAIFMPSCLPCPFGPGPELVEVFDKDGCLEGYTCGPCDPCGDGSDALCMMIPPDCAEGTVLSVQGGCFTCVDPNTCEPPVECVVSGCNGEICAPFEMFSTCEASPEYACLSLTTCGADASGQCGWEQNDAYLACLEEVTGGATICEDETGAYAPGESWDAADGCNTCFCTEDGVAACTKMACPVGCAYGDAWYGVDESFPATDGCNTCWCMEDGSVACTEMACVEGCTDETGSYAIGQSWDVDCNVCTCLEGGEIACTKVLCDGGCDYEGQWYTPGETFPSSDGCNSCWCTEDGQAVAMACIEGCQTKEGEMYLPGESWEAADGCNTCTCDQGGQISCTEMFCQ